MIFVTYLLVAYKRSGALELIAINFRFLGLELDFIKIYPENLGTNAKKPRHNKVIKTLIMIFFHLVAPRSFSYSVTTSKVINCSRSLSVDCSDLSPPALCAWFKTRFFCPFTRALCRETCEECNRCIVPPATPAPCKEGKIWTLYNSLQYIGIFENKLS